MARAWIVPALLAAAAVAGFAVISIKTRKGPQVQSNARASRYHAEISRINNDWFVTILDGAKPVRLLLGPEVSEEDIDGVMNDAMRELGVPVFYSLQADDDGMWWFEGWADGETITEANGPYGGKAIASSAGSRWADDMAASMNGSGEA